MLCEEINHPEPFRNMGTFSPRAGDDPPGSSYSNAFRIQTRAEQTRRGTTRGLTRGAPSPPTCQRSGPDTPCGKHYRCTWGLGCQETRVQAGC